VSKLEAETGQLHSELIQSQQTVKSLEGRLAGMEAELIEQQQRVSSSVAACSCLLLEAGSTTDSAADFQGLCLDLIVRR
jgi:hypothetical protein